MKTLIVLFCILSLYSLGQTISSRSSEVALDFSDPKKGYVTSAPSIRWQAPLNQILYLKDNNLSLKVLVTAKKTLKSVKVVIRDKVSNEIKGQLNINSTEETKYNLTIDRSINLPDGIDLIEIIAENTDGIKSSSVKTAYVGQAIAAQAAKLNRQDYALIFATDKYDNWAQLVNPIFDGRSIAEDLKKYYGFKTDIVENPTREQVFLKLREYAEKKYDPLDQLLIFFAGHGIYDETFKEGYVVPKEALQNDPSRTSYIRHSELRSSIDKLPSEHVLLVMDVCFGGTFDEEIVTRSLDDMYAEASQADIILRKLQFKTRKYITSGGKEYVSDGIARSHSPFAKQFIAALESQGGNDGLLTISELTTYLEKLKTPPQFGKFGSDKLGSEFIFSIH